MQDLYSPFFVTEIRGGPGLQPDKRRVKTAELLQLKKEGRCNTTGFPDSGMQ